MATSGRADVPSAEEVMTADEISQAQKRRILAEDRLATTYHSASQAFVDEERGGRFAALEKPTVTGSSGAVRYPRQREGSPWRDDPVGVEPPLGFDVNTIEPVGEVHERAGTSPSSSAETAASVGVGEGVRRATKWRRV